MVVIGLRAAIVMNMMMRLYNYYLWGLIFDMIGDCVGGENVTDK